MSFDPRERNRRKREEKRGREGEREQLGEGVRESRVEAELRMVACRRFHWKKWCHAQGGFSRRKDKSMERESFFFPAYNWAISIFFFF